jgi:WD40 repeat protein
MNSSPNPKFPYTIGGIMGKNDPSYVTRQADRELYDALKAGQYCYMFNARQMGKSSLQVRVTQRLQDEGVACGVVSMQAVVENSSTEEGFYHGLLNRLNKIMGLEIQDLDLKQWFQQQEGIPHITRFLKFLEDFLLKKITQKIVIFFDEIDKILSHPFKDDFFAVLRTCYDMRHSMPIYQRLTFAFLGVTAPSDLIQDKRQSPFNIGTAINLKGFQLEEAKPLMHGLGNTERPEVVLEEILYWTGGQPFLTQRLCKLVMNRSNQINSYSEKEAIKDIVNLEIIEDWGSKDEQIHFKMISDRILESKKPSILLDLYSSIQKNKNLEIKSDNSYEQIELRLTGLVVKEQGKLRVYNPIYERIFDQKWVSSNIADLCPYKESFTAWKSSKNDKKWLLRGRNLIEAKEWNKGKNLSNEENKFIAASERSEKEENKNIIFRSFIMSFSFVVLSILVFRSVEWLYLRSVCQKPYGITTMDYMYAHDKGIQYIVTGQSDGKVNLLKNLSYPVCVNHINHIDHKDIISAVKFSPSKKQLASASLDGKVLLTNLENRKNEIPPLTHISPVTSINFNHNGKYLATSTHDGTLRIWDTLSGTEIRREDFNKNLDNNSNHNVYINQIIFSKDGRYLAASGLNEFPQLFKWDSVNNKLEFLRAIQIKSNRVVFSPRENVLALASSNGILKILTIQDSQVKIVKSLSLDSKNDILKTKEIFFSPDGETIAITRYDTEQKIQLWKWKNGQKQFNNINNVLESAFSSDGNYLAVGTTNREIQLYSTTQDYKKPLSTKTLEGNPVAIKFSPDEKNKKDQFLTVVDSKGNITVLNINQMIPN